MVYRNLSKKIDRMFYFCGSIRGGLDDTKIYHELIKTIKEFGTCITEHVGELEYLEKEHLSDQEIYAKDMGWLKSSKLVVAEVSVPSTGVGYELGIAESLGLPTLVLYRSNASKRISAMVSGNAFFTVKNYTTVQEAQDHIRDFISANM